MGKSFLAAAFFIVGTFFTNASAKIMMMYFSPFATMNELQFYSGLYESLDNRGLIKEFLAMNEKDRIEFLSYFADETLNNTIPKSDIEELKDLNTYELIQYQSGEDIRAFAQFVNIFTKIDKQIKAKMIAYFHNDENFKNGLQRESIFTRIADFLSNFLRTKQEMHETQEIIADKKTPLIQEIIEKKKVRTTQTEHATQAVIAP